MSYMESLPNERMRNGGPLVVSFRRIPLFAAMVRECVSACVRECVLFWGPRCGDLRLGRVAQKSEKVTAGQTRV